MKVEIDLYEITKTYENKQAQWFFIKNAIKSAIVDEKIKNGSDCEIIFIERKGYDLPFDLAINGNADTILKQLEDSLFSS